MKAGMRVYLETLHNGARSIALLRCGTERLDVAPRVARLDRLVTRLPSNGMAWQTSAIAKVRIKRRFTSFTSGRFLIAVVLWLGS